MKRLLKILGSTILVLLFLSSGIAGLAWWKKESILRVMVDELNKNLLVPVEVAEMELSLDHFPSVAIRFHKLFIADPKQKGDTLVFLEKLDVASNLQNWIHGNYKINNLYAQSGRIEIRQYADETWNFQSVYTPSAENSNRNIELKGLRADQIQLYYFQPKEKQKLQSYLSSVDLQGDLSNFQDLQIKAEHSAFEFWLKDMKIETTEGRIQLQQKQDLWSGSWSHTYGELNFDEKEKHWDFTAETQDILRLASWVNAEIPKELQLLNGSWQASGIWQKASNEAEIEWIGKRIEAEWSGYPRLQMELAGSWQMDGDSSSLEVKTMEARAEQMKLTAKGHMRLDGKKSGNFQANLDINDLKEFSAYADSLPSNLVGKLNATLSYKGALVKESILKSLLAEIEIDGVGFDYDRMEIRKAKGTVSRKGNHWQIENLLLLLNQQEVFANGEILWTTEQDYVPSAQLKIRMRSLDLSKWKNGSESSAFELPNVEMDVVLDATDFKMNTLRLNQLKLSFKSDKNGVVVDKLFAEGLGGELRGELSFLKISEKYQLRSFCELENISIDALFKSFDNFGQEVLTSEHLKGRLSSEFNLELELDAQARINLDKLQVKGVVSLLNAELIRFAPLEALSVFAQRDELNHLKMKEHIQPIEIHSGAVWLPLTTVKTNAFELKIKGEHRFNNWIDYTVQLPIEALIKKGKKSKGEFDDWIVEVQERKQPGIYVKIKGEMNALDIQWDKDATQEGLKQEWQRNANPFRKDTTIAPIKSSGGIQFDWDEDEG